MSRSRMTVGLVLLAVLAFGLRLAAVLVLGSYREPFAYEHGEIAENLLAGRGFSVTFLGQHGRTSQQAPLYPCLLAAAYWLWGVKSPHAFLAVQLAQCVAGALTAVCAAWLAWSVYRVQGSGFRVQESGIRSQESGVRDALGWIAGVLVAAHPAQVYMVTHIQIAPWATLALTLLAAVALSPRWQGRWSGAVLVGLLAGTALLIEPIFIVAMPIIAAAFCLKDVVGNRRGNVTRALTYAATMAAVASSVAAPWLWRNYRVHGEFVFIKSTFGYAFWQGNNPLSWGTDKIPKPTVSELLVKRDGSLASLHRAAWEARHETLYIDDLLLKPTGYSEFVGLSEPERCRLLGERAWQFIREQPAQYARLCLNRLRYFILWDETNPKTASWPYRGTTLFWLVLCLAGAWTTRRRWSKMWPLYAVCGAVLLFHVLTITSARFRLPLEPLTLVWAAGAVTGAIWRKGSGVSQEQAQPRYNS